MACEAQNVFLIRYRAALCDCMAEVETQVWRKKEPRYASAKIQLEGRGKEDKYVKSSCVSCGTKKRS